jgi:hypothetical protein
MAELDLLGPLEGRVRFLPAELDATAQSVGA